MLIAGASLTAHVFAMPFARNMALLNIAELLSLANSFGTYLAAQFLLVSDVSRCCSA